MFSHDRVSQPFATHGPGSFQAAHTFRSHEAAIGALNEFAAMLLQSGIGSFAAHGEALCSLADLGFIIQFMWMCTFIQHVGEIRQLPPFLHKGETEAKQAGFLLLTSDEDANCVLKVISEKQGDLFFFEKQLRPSRGQRRAVLYT